MQELWPDIVAGVIVAAAFLIGLRIAYRRGFRSALSIHAGELDFLPSQLSLDGSEWVLQLNEHDDLSQIVGPTVLRLTQSGSRILGEGSRENGAAWQLEGILHGRELLCFIAETPPAGAPNVLILRADAHGKRLSGYRLDWQETGALLSLREIAFARQRSSAKRPNSPTAIRF